MSRARRRRAERRGRLAELVAGLWLMGKGYRIVAIRARTPYGEVDLVAYKRGLLAMIEVKARPTLAEGFDSIGYRQQQRVARAGLDLARRYRLHAAAVRLDLMLVRPWALPRHVPDAWSGERS